MYALINTKIYTGHDVLTEHAVLVDADKIQSIVKVGDLPKR